MTTSLLLFINITRLVPRNSSIRRMRHWHHGVSRLPQLPSRLPRNKRVHHESDRFIGVGAAWKSRSHKRRCQARPTIFHDRKEIIGPCNTCHPPSSYNLRSIAWRTFQLHPNNKRLDYEYRFSPSVKWHLRVTSPEII
jgi:hypothetical protein